MSSSQEESDDDEPKSKKQKVDESGEVVHSDALGGPMYTEATAQKILEGMPLLDKGGWADDSASDGMYDVTPMIYFARQGDLKMCRYLVSRGASTTKVSSNHFWCPMYAAALSGCLDICKFLYAHGAKNDIRKVNGARWSPFLTASIRKHDELMRWLVLHGALCADDNSDYIEVERLKRNSYANGDCPKLHQSYTKLLEWAEETIQNRSSLLMFLLGTLPSSDTSSGQPCILQNLSGHLGVRKHIAAFVETECLTPKHLRILHQLTEVLPSVLSHLKR